MGQLHLRDLHYHCRQHFQSNQPLLLGCLIEHLPSQADQLPLQNEYLRQLFPQEDHSAHQELMERNYWRVPPELYFLKIHHQ
jgi:hypothetical protein